MGQLVRHWDKDDKFLSATYNELGIQDSMTKVIDEGAITSRHYSYQNPYGAKAVYDARGSYDENSGNYLVQMNEIDSYTYSPTGRLLSQINSYTQNTFVNGVYFEPYMDYSYDTNGNVLSAYSGLYDEANSAVWGFATNYEYDKNRLTKVQVDGNIERNTTDNANVRYEYYADGKLKSVTYPALTDNSILKSEYVYDGFSRLTSLTNYKGTDVLSSYTYTYDSNGNILTANETVGEAQYSTTYTYDLNNRLLESNEVMGDAEVNTKYFYDANGNQTTKAVMASEVYDGASAGHTISDDTNEYLAIYDYNCYNQLIGVDTDGAVSSYTYSPDGLRHSKTVGGETTTFVYDVANVIEEITADGAKKYYRGIEIVKNNNGLYYLYNGQGDVSLLTDNYGRTVANYSFDAYGKQSMGNTVYNPFGYRGEYSDAESGLIYLRARMYDPSTGRFINEDPIRDGLNWYVYCENNPIMFVDPWGLAITDEDFAAYNDGRMSSYAWKMLNEADEMWNSAKSDDYNTKAIAHNMAQVARASYSNIVDNFDYTFGTGYYAIDRGEPGKYINVAYGYSTNGKYSGTVFLYYERYLQNGKNYLKIVKSEGYASGNAKERIYASGIKYTYGASKWFGSTVKEGTTDKSRYSITFSDIHGVPDDGGVYHVTGINVTFDFCASRNTEYSLTIVNNVYDSFYINEKGDTILKAEIPSNYMEGRTYYYNR